MAIVRVHGPLKRLAGGQTEHQVPGGNVSALLDTLESTHPGLVGWILDERGSIRRHINVYINGELGNGDTAVGDGDRVEVLPAISGGGGASD